MIATPAYFMTAGPFPECPRRGAPQLLREGSKPHGRDATRLGSREPGPALAGRAQTEMKRLLALDFLAGSWAVALQASSSAISNPSHVLAAGTNDGQNDSPFRSHFDADDK